MNSHNVPNTHDSGLFFVGKLLLIIIHIYCQHRKEFVLFALLEIVLYPELDKKGTGQDNLQGVLKPRAHMVN